MGAAVLLVGTTNCVKYAWPDVQAQAVLWFRL